MKRVINLNIGESNMAENDFGIAIIGMAGRFKPIRYRRFGKIFWQAESAFLFTAMRNCWRWESVLNLFSTQITSRPKGGS